MPQASETALSRLQRRVYQVVELSGPGNPAGRWFDIAISALIVLNILAVILETVGWIYAQFVFWFHWFDVISVAIFTAEYAARLWVCTMKSGFERPIAGRLRYARTPMAIIDLLAILPFYLPMFMPFDLRQLRALRLFRLLRALKLVRYSRSLRVIGGVFRSHREQLLIALSIELVLLMVVASIMYFVEHEAQPEAFSSIPAAMWWAVVTLSTVGYGDVAPVTPLGKVCGGVVALLGVAMFAVPAGILASGFSEQIAASGRPTAAPPRYCPHCGRALEISAGASPSADGGSDTMPPP